MSEQKQTIIYTLTDESPLLAACSLLPIIRTFTAPADIHLKKSDISLMPADLQKVMTEQDLVDVVEYLMTLTKAKDFTQNDR